MTEPRRLLEDGTEFERDLLESAALDAPSAARRRRLIAASAAATTALAASSASGATAAGIAAWKIVVGVIAVGSLTAVVVVPREKAAVVDATPTVIVRAPRALPSIAVVATNPSPSVTPVVVTSAAPSAPPLPPPSAASSASLDLAREIARIDAARKAVAAHDGAAALHALDGYDKEFPGGSLAVEAAALRVEATALAGDPARASTLARAFLAAHPGSSYAKRVGKYVTNP